MAFVALRSIRTPPPNILLITLDTTRADHVGAYGYPLARTPTLDLLAREGVLFERALTSAPITLPAHASLFTGTYPFAHGVRNNGNFYLAPRFPTSRQSSCQSRQSCLCFAVAVGGKEAWIP